MRNSYQLNKAVITKVVRENPTTKTLVLKLKNQASFKFIAGQFMQVGLPGFGECPISISSAPRDSAKFVSLTIRNVGELTGKLISLKKGDSVWIRGPFGNGFPEVEENLIIIGGGCGFIPLHSVYKENKDKKNINIQLFIGCSEKDTIVFEKEFDKIKQRADLNVILEKGTLPGYAKKKGFVTELLKESDLLPGAKVFVCGPPLMYSFVAKELIKKKIKPEDIYFSLEKRMHCGVGVCQHCAIGPKYVCKDGPVFDYAFLKEQRFL